MKEELKNVMQKAAEYLDDAQYLFNDGRYESAVNRAYYSIFTAVQGLLLDKDVFVKTHAGTKLKFSELFLKTNLLPLDLGKIFEKALTLRQEADYDFQFHVSNSDAEQLIADAHLFLKTVTDFLQK